MSYDSDNRYGGQPALPGTTGCSKHQFKPDPLDEELSWEDEKAQDEAQYEALREQLPDLEPPF